MQGFPEQEQVNTCDLPSPSLSILINAV